MPDDETASAAVPAIWGGARLWAARRLSEAGVTATPDLDAAVLLGHVTGATRAALLAYPERALAAEQATAFGALVARRLAAEPVAYLTGHQEFMGLDLLTDARALIPRPETEHLVEAALAEVRARLANGADSADDADDAAPLVADIGTGSGAIALALAKLEPRLPRVYATDLSADALDLAAENARRLGVSERVTLLAGDLLVPLPEPVDLLLANLPYVAPRDAAILPPDVRRYEPGLALYGADDGMGHLRRLLAMAPGSLRPGAAIFLEFGYDQRAALEALARATFPAARVRVVADYAGWDRLLIIKTAP